jgi:hypothetical protein
LEKIKKFKNKDKRTKCIIEIYNKIIP